MSEITNYSISTIDLKLIKCAAKQMLYWPTSPENLKKNCSLYEQLDPNGLIIPGLDENSDYYKFACDFAYVTMALKQRGLVNMTYYTLVNDYLIAIDKYLSGEEDEQSGGVKVKTLSVLGFAFANLGKSQGLNSELVVSSDSKNLRQVDEARFQSASERFRKLLQEEPWILPEKEVTIAKGISREAAKYFIQSIDDTNSRLAEIGLNARRVCTSIVGDLEGKELFSNTIVYEDFIENVNQLTGEQSEKRFSHSIQDNLAYFTNAGVASTTAVYSGLSGQPSSSRQINEVEIVKKATDQVNNDIAKTITPIKESFSYAIQYRTYCKATPLPKFIVEEEQEKPGNIVIKMKTIFGNKSTGVLLEYHVDTLNRIQLKIKNTNDVEEKKYLQSLSEKIVIQLQIIESSSLFAPLDGLFPGIDTLKTTLLESKLSVIDFEELVKRLEEDFPISGREHNVRLQINKDIAKRKSETLQLEFDTWRVYFSQTTRAGLNTLTDATANLAEAGEDVIKQAENISKIAVGSIGNITSDITDVGTKEFKKVSKTLKDEIYDWVILLIPIVGIGAALAIIWTLIRNPALFEKLFVRTSTPTPTAVPGMITLTPEQFQQFQQLLAQQSRTDQHLSRTPTRSRNVIDLTGDVIDLTGDESSGGKRRKSRKTKRTKFTKRNRKNKKNIKTRKNRKTRKYRKKY